jgi:hypothetical protein
MKALLFLFVAHLVLCATAGYLFHERSESHRNFDPPTDSTSAEERARGETSFQFSHGRVAIQFPGALNLYFFAGILALVVALIIEVYERFVAR